jgi:hypothetical protein
MFIISDYEDQVMREIDAVGRNMAVRPLNLLPPGGLIGQLPQTRVGYDVIESVDPTIPASGVSLIINLNRIRAGASLGSGIIHTQHLGLDVISLIGSGGAGGASLYKVKTIGSDLSDFTTVQAAIDAQASDPIMEFEGHYLLAPEQFGDFSTSAPSPVILPSTDGIYYSFASLFTSGADNQMMGTYIFTNTDNTPVITIPSTQYVFLNHVGLQCNHSSSFAVSMDTGGTFYMEHSDIRGVNTYSIVAANGTNSVYLKDSYIEGTIDFTNPGTDTVLYMENCTTNYGDVNAAYTTYIIGGQFGGYLNMPTGSTVYLEGTPVFFGVTGDGTALGAWQDFEGSVHNLLVVNSNNNNIYHAGTDNKATASPNLNYLTSGGDNILVVGADNINRIGVDAQTSIVLVRDDVNGNLALETYSNTYTPIIAGYRARGNRSAPEDILTNDTIVRLTGRGWIGGAWADSSRFRLDARASEDWTPTAQGTKVIFSITKDGETTLTDLVTMSGLGMSVSGTVVISDRLIINNAGTPIDVQTALEESVSGTNDSIARSSAISAGVTGSTADSKAVSDSVNISVVDSRVTSSSVSDSTSFSTVNSKDVSQSILISTADSKASSDSSDPTAGSKADSAGQQASTADSKALSDSVNISVTDSRVTSNGTSDSTNQSITDSKDLSQSQLISSADSKAVSGTPDSTARSKADSAGQSASSADSKAVSDSILISSTDSKVVSSSVSDSANLSATDSKDVSQSVLISTADSKAVSGSPDSIARSSADSAGLAASTADSKAISDSVNTSTVDSSASSKDTSQSILVSTADSKAVSGVPDSVARSKGDSAGQASSTADSKAVSDSITISTADSKAVSSGNAAGVADSKAVSDSVNTSTVDSTASSKDTSQSTLVSTADSKAVSVGNIFPIEEAEMSFSDVTTLNATTSRHGFLAKLTGQPGQYLGGDGNWYDLPTTLSEFLEDTNADVGGYKSLQPSVPAGVTANVSASVTAADTVIGSFIAPAGEFDFISAQVLHVHAHLAKTAGTKTVTVHAHLYLRAAGGSETSLGQSVETAALTGTSDPYDMDVSIADTPFLSTDRLVVKFMATPGPSGSTPTANVYYQGDTNSRVEIGASSASAAGVDSQARSKADSSGLVASTADSKAVSNSVVESSNLTTANSKDASQSLLISTADSKAVSDSVGISSVNSAVTSSVSTANSKDTSQSILISTSDSKAVSDGSLDSVSKSTADSKDSSQSLLISGTDSRVTSSSTIDSTNLSTVNSKDTSQSILVSTADSKAVSSAALDSVSLSTSDSKTTSAVSTANSKDVSQSILISTTDSKATSDASLDSVSKSTADSKDTSQSTIISTNLTTVNSKDTSQSILVSTADSKGVSAGTQDSTSLSTSNSKDTSQSILISTADSKGVSAASAATDSIARSKGDSSGQQASVADSKAVSDSVLISSANSAVTSSVSTANSKDTSQSILISTSDSKAVSDASLDSTSKSTADSNNTSQSTLISTADSKGVSGGSAAGTDSIARSKGDSAGTQDSTSLSTSNSKDTSQSVLISTADSKSVSAATADALKTITIGTSGLGLSGGGDLSANRTITLTSSANPGASSSILATDSSGILTLSELDVSVFIATGRSIRFYDSGTTNTMFLFAGPSSISSNRIVYIPDMGGTLALGAGTLTVSSSNDVTAATHTHAITSSSAPGAAASILATDSSGTITLAGQLKVSSTTNQIVLQSAGVTGTITWTPTSSGKTITLPDFTGTAALGAGSATSSSTNSVASANHTHAIDSTIARSNISIGVSGLGLSGGGDLTANRTITLTSSSAPGAAAAILASDSGGSLTLAGGLNIGSSGATAGQIKTSAAIFAGGHLYPDGEGEAYFGVKRINSLANNGTVQLGNVAQPFGLFMITGYTSGFNALYWVNGGLHTCTEVSDPGAKYTPTAGTASSTNMYWSAGNARYELENKEGGTRTYVIYMMTV